MWSINPIFLAQATPSAGSAVSWWALPVGPFTVGELGLAFLLVLLTVFARSFLVRVTFAQLRKLAERTRMDYDDRFLEALEKPLSLFLLLFGLFLAFNVLPVDPGWAHLVSQLFRGGSILLVFWGLLRQVDVLVDVMSAMARLGERDSLRGFVPLIKKSIRIFLGVVGAVMIFDNLGYDIGGILATLGIGGVAFAIAAKDTIANLYASVALALDRPFQVGDWIRVGDKVDGDVEAIGLRSTKVRTWPKTVISIPNAVLANEMIDNWSRMPKRRVKQIIGVTYDTSPTTMNALVNDFREILQMDEGVNKEFILVNWTDFGASSLDILVYYFTKTTKWLDYLAVRQRINTKLAEAVAARGSAVAFPTRTLHLDGDALQALAGGPLPGDGGPQQPR